MGNQCSSICVNDRDPKDPGIGPGTKPPGDDELRKANLEKAATRIQAGWVGAKTRREIFDKRQGKPVAAFPWEKPRSVTDKEAELGPFQIDGENFLIPATQKIFKIDENTCYQGYWLYGMREKVGVEVKMDGSIYEGGFVKDKYDGRGRKIFSDGSYYEGSWEDGVRHGSGTFVDVYKAKYSGDWKADKKDGKCIEEWPEGEIFQGHYKDGRKNGHGEFKWKNGSKYIGEFNNDCMHGRGRYVWNNGNEYSGEWKDNMMDGTGKFTNDSGVYVGEFKRDLKHGTGEFTDREGRRYVGEWQEGKRHGKGTVYMTDNSQRTGIWEKGQRKSWLNEETSPRGNSSNS
mmetsp:Transcript_24835/g.28354  ORF Transcript_24835/g.28354 Transcript_24835/m.28354 type:complete len:344 (-) Transcript_24835:539-1570(-)